MYGVPAKNCSGPENHNASILLGRHIANAMIFSIVFEHRDRSKRRHRSIRRQKNDVRFLFMNTWRASKKNGSGPENRDASILLGKHTVNAWKNSMVWAALDGKVATRLPNGAGAWLGWVLSSS